MIQTNCTVQEIQKILPYISNATASRKINLIKSALNKPKPKMITINEFREYFGI